MASSTSLEALSDDSQCSSPAEQRGPEGSPLARPLFIGDGVGIRLEHFWDRRRSTSGCDSVGTSITTPSEDSLRDNSVRNICFVGAGYVGGPTAAVIALHNPHIRVEVLDRDEIRIKRWRSQHLPIHEPGLEPVIRVARDGASRVLRAADGRPAPDDVPHIERRPNLYFTTDDKRSISNADIVFLAVNTSTKTFGVGAGRATNMSALDGAVQNIAQHAKPGTIIVEKSTVPVGTAQRIKSKLRVLRPGVRFEVLSNPEFLAEGSAIENLIRPDRVLIGCSDTPSGHIAANVLAEVYASWVPRSRIVGSNVWSSELTKLVANALLAQRVSSINSISAICEKTGADVDDIAEAVGRDARIGPHFLKAGLGFGGSCFKKDLLSLTYIAQSLNLDEVAEYWDSVNRINELQRHRFVRKVIGTLDANLVGKKITLLGFAFKKNTGDPRESPAVDVVKTLLEEMPGELAIFDPFCKTRDIAREIAAACPVPAASSHDGDLGPVKAYGDVYRACSRADAVLIVTDHPQFRVSIPGAPPQDVQSSMSVAAAEEPHGKHASVRRIASTDDVYRINSCDYALSLQPKCTAGALHCPDCSSSSSSVSLHSGDTTGGDNGTDPSAAAKMQPLQWPRILAGLKEPRLIFDGRGVVDRRKLEGFGMEVTVESTGRARASAVVVDDFEDVPRSAKKLPADGAACL